MVVIAGVEAIVGHLHRERLDDFHVFRIDNLDRVAIENRYGHKFPIRRYCALIGTSGDRESAQHFSAHAIDRLQSFFGLDGGVSYMPVRRHGNSVGVLSDFPIAGQCEMLKVDDADVVAFAVGHQKKRLASLALGQAESHGGSSHR